jgi:hypothetical protein
MEDEEELYRLMNEEDDFYMGDEDDKASTGNAGCAGIFLFIIILLTIALNF